MILVLTKRLRNLFPEVLLQVSFLRVHPADDLVDVQPDGQDMIAVSGAWKDTTGREIIPNIQGPV